MTQEELEKLQILDQLRIYEQEKLVQHSEEAKAYIEKLAQNERRKLCKTNLNTLLHTPTMEQR